MNAVVEHRLTLWVDLEDLLGDLALISIGLGPASELCILAMTNPSEIRLGGTFTTDLERSYDYVVFLIDEWNTFTFSIDDQRSKYHYIQPLPDNELLLVCSRSEYFGPDRIDLNGHVFSDDGVLQRQFLLGDGISHVYTTTDGSIWTGYFDEGVIGSNGWDLPIGQSGLIKWNKIGSKEYVFSPPAPQYAITDCYALNVASDDETWCYYYTEFPLVQIHKSGIKNYWNTPMRGSDGFAVWREFALFRGGYNQQGEYVLLRLKDDHQMEKLGSYRLINADGDFIHVDCCLDARGSQLMLVSKMKCYRLFLNELRF